MQLHIQLVKGFGLSGVILVIKDKGQTLSNIALAHLIVFPSTSIEIHIKLLVIHITHFIGMAVDNTT